MAQFDPDRFRDPALAAGLVARIARLAGRPAALMEVCGTHTMAIAQHGIRGLIPASITLLSGPGCPVCVTALADIDRMIAIASLDGVITATFGDMVRVPGSAGSLGRAKAGGADVRTVYSPLDALAIAAANPGRQVVFAGVGFETTAPTIAATVLEAERDGLGNFSVYPAFKLVPPALEAVLSGAGAAVDGLLLPGHVSAIIGTGPYRFIAERYRTPCAIAGFEPLDILEAIALLLEQRESGRTGIANEYRRGVPEAGNPEALRLLDRVFQPVDAVWRAVGALPRSGLGFREPYAAFDASRKFPVTVVPAPEPEGCRCGQVMMGLARPDQCGHFGTSCTPSRPVGPCMVSSEGACAAWYKYGVAA
ncbi:MAG: hydrogenase formation protein HypD [Candidatus Edwardsbacteria bacterium]|jgi:hydrogenase expression/formation protein HypD|nr:hydrogenase formation protein HypD [Candidatus Edwardsbacteria bacterium]